MQLQYTKFLQSCPWEFPYATKFLAIKDPVVARSLTCVSKQMPDCLLYTAPPLPRTPST